jgi:hypothetical protein
MASDITARKAKILRDFAAVLKRSRDLRTRLAVDGLYNKNGRTPPLPNTDKRDITVFLFFETAAAFESLAQEAFILCTRKEFSVQPKKAEHIAGSIDNGLERVMGWAAPPMIVKRSKAIFGKRYFLSLLQHNLPQGHYDWLSHAHRTRNRIAHPSGKAKKELNRLQTALGIPAAERKGTGPGRILSDYPSNSPADDRWFHRFLKAYESFASLIQTKL